MNLFRNKLFIGLMCVALGLSVVFFAAPAALSEQTKTAEVVAAATDIKAGTVISAEMVKTMRIPAGIAPADAINQEASVGKYAASKIWAGDIITAAKIADTNTPDDTYALATAKGRMVASVTVRNLSVMAAARIKAGDVVTVMALLDGTNGGNSNADQTGIATSAEQTADITNDAAVQASAPVKDVREIEPTVVIYPELKYMEIAAIVASEGENASVKTDLSGDEKNTLPVTISFYADEDQARRLAELEMNGTIYIAFVARGEEAFAFIPAAEKVLTPDTK